MKSLLCTSAIAMLMALSATALVAEKHQGPYVPKKNTYVSKNADKIPAVGAYPKAWISLFPPPFNMCPEIMLNFGCTTDNVCYVPGGSNGVGFGVYRLDGVTDGNFTALKSIDNFELDFTLFAGIAGTATEPKGALGGVSLWKGLKYFVNDSWLAPANIPISEEQAISVDKTGNQVLMVDGFIDTFPGVGLYSTDAGKTYTGFSIDANPINKTCTLPLWQSIAADNTWIIAAGSFPESNSGSGGNGQTKTNKVSPLRMMSKRSALVKPGTTAEEVAEYGFELSKTNPLLAKRSLIKTQQEWEKRSKEGTLVGRKKRHDGPECPYSAAVFATTDGGKTWMTNDFNTSIWSPDAIACSDATTCMMVGSGMAEFPGSRVMKTVDGGKTWKDAFFLPSEAGEEVWAMNALAYNPTNPQEAWLGGGVENAAGTFAVFFVTTDGGSTWTRGQEVDFVEEIMEISFTQEGNIFALGLTQFDDSTVLRYTVDGFPQTPAPVYLGNFTQTQCDDSHCSVNCTSLSLPQNKCLNLTNGGSAIGHCDLANRVLIQDIFPIDQVCSGPSEPQPQALNVCFELQGGGSFKNECGPAGGDVAPAPKDAMFKVLPKNKKH